MSKKLMAVYMVKVFDDGSLDIKQQKIDVKEDNEDVSKSNVSSRIGQAVDVLKYCIDAYKNNECSRSDVLLTSAIQHVSEKYNVSKPTIHSKIGVQMGMKISAWATMLDEYFENDDYIEIKNVLIKNISKIHYDADKKYIDDFFNNI